jgi:transposase-like protein
MKNKATITRENLHWLFEQPMDIKLGLLEQHMSICRLVVNQILDEEVTTLAGERYSHDKPRGGRYSRYGFNPGSVPIADEKVRIEVPRVRDEDSGAFRSLKSYEQMKDNTAGEERIMQGVLKGLSMNDYGSVIDQLGESFGMSRASISNRFIEQTLQALKEFEARKWTDQQFIALFVDGLYLGSELMVVVMGITEQGQKRMLDFAQTNTENSRSIKAMFERLIKRGLHYKQGLLFVIDGGKGLHKAIVECFGKYAIIQRCRWHKLRNVLSYLAEKHHAVVRKKYLQALAQPTYAKAKAALVTLTAELQTLNLEAARSLQEGLEELLTLHKLEVNDDFQKSFGTTNCIESLNSNLRKHIGKVKYWKNSLERYRWLAASLIIIEPRLNKIFNFQKLKTLRKAIQKHLKLKNTLKSNP